MANNRLYLGNRATKEYIFVAKGFGQGWSVRVNNDILEGFIEDQNEAIGETDVGGKTNLIYFTEYDDAYDDFIRFKNGHIVTKAWDDKK